jgi:hydrogenase maturation protease
VNDQATIAPVLVLTYGNPSRGDDALGTAMFDLLEANPPANVDLLTDFQLQIEHATDLEHRDYILFIDAGVSCKEPFELNRLSAEKDDSFTTHAMSPASVLSVYQQVYHRDPPPAYLLTIRAYEFGLGKEMSDAARQNLNEAYAYLMEHPPWKDKVKVNCQSAHSGN